MTVQTCRAIKKRRLPILIGVDSAQLLFAASLAPCPQKAAQVTSACSRACGILPAFTSDNSNPQGQSLQSSSPGTQNQNPQSCVQEACPSTTQSWWAVLLHTSQVAAWVEIQVQCCNKQAQSAARQVHGSQKKYHSNQGGLNKTSPILKFYTFSSTNSTMSIRTYVNLLSNRDAHTKRLFNSDTIGMISQAYRRSCSSTMEYKKPK